MRRNIIQSYFEVAIDHSMKAIPKYSSRKAVIGAIGIRKDNKIVHAHNGGAKQHHPDSHAEARLCSKLGPGATVFIARIRRDNFCLDLAKPCINCFKS